MGWRYYIRQPWKWFRDCGRKVRDWYRRCKFGWTYSDAWNWDTWFIETVPPMLRHIADHGMGYPGQEPFNTPEQWHTWLHKIADLIDTASEDWQNEHNEYYEEYINGIMASASWIDEFGLVHTTVKSEDEIDKKYFARANELAEEGQKNMEEAMEQLGRYFHWIWD